MAEIERKVQKIFAGGLSANGNIAKYGSKEAGTVGYSLDLDEIQTQRWLNGLAGSVSQDKAPYLQDLNAVFYTITKQLAYLFQAGIAEWNSETEYFANKSFVMYNGEVYRAIQNNTNQTPTNTTYWTKIVGLNMGIPEYNSSVTYKKGQIVSYNYNDTTTILLKSLVDNNTSAPSFSPSIEQGNVYRAGYIVEVIGVYNSSSSFPASANSGEKALSLNDFTIYTFKSGSWVGTFNLKQLSADYITIKDLSTNNLWQYAYINGSGDTMINIMDSLRMYPPAKKWLVINPILDNVWSGKHNRICVYERSGKTIYSDGSIEIEGNIEISDGQVGNFNQTWTISFFTILKDGYNIDYCIHTPSGLSSQTSMVSSITTIAKQYAMLQVVASNVPTGEPAVAYFRISGKLNIENN